MRRFKNIRHLISAFIAVVRFGYPARSLTVIGVTGTDGKTTTTSIIYHLLKESGLSVGLVSTVAAYIRDEKIETGLHVTSPDPTALQRLLRRAVNEKVKYMVLEATSHGLDQHRLFGTNVSYAVLTNITHEHLDYHKTIKNYAKSKSKLFKFAKKIYLNPYNDSEQLIAPYLNHSSAITKCFINRLPVKVKKIIDTRFSEEYNRQNATQAVYLALDLGISEANIIKAVRSFPGVEGRLESVPNKLGLSIYVDFAHTPNALENVLKSVKAQKKGKIICVFGCAGLRDSSKRPLMADLATTIADKIIFTTEDPRTEKPSEIFSQMEAGVKTENVSKYKIIPDRGTAIFEAINKTAKRGDIVLICGKGHEKSMCFGTTEYEWSDKEAIEMALSGKIKQIKL